MVTGGLKKVKRGVQVSFSSKVEKKKLEYKDKFPETLPTIEDVKEKYGVVVWCKYLDCINNQEIDILRRSSGTILKNRQYNPINEQEHIWEGICTRSEIAIKFDTITSASGGKVKIPSCFVAATNKTGHIDFSKFLNSDGTPLGGNIDSQHVSDAGYGALDSNNIYQ